MTRAVPSAAHIVEESQSLQRFFSSQGYPADTTLTKQVGEHWRETLRLRHIREAARDHLAQVRSHNSEESKWTNVPAWKRKLLTEKRQRQWDSEAPAREAAARDEQEQAKFNSYPAWK